MLRPYKTMSQPSACRINLCNITLNSNNAHYTPPPPAFKPACLATRPAIASCVNTVF